MSQTNLEKDPDLVEWDDKQKSDSSLSKKHSHTLLGSSKTPKQINKAAVPKRQGLVGQLFHHKYHHHLHHRRTGVTTSPPSAQVSKNTMKTDEDEDEEEAGMDETASEPSSPTSELETTNGKRLCQSCFGFIPHVFKQDEDADDEICRLCRRKASRLCHVGKRFAIFCLALLILLLLAILLFYFLMCFYCEPEQPAYESFLTRLFGNRR